MCIADSPPNLCSFVDLLDQVRGSGSDHPFLCLCHCMPQPLWFCFFFLGPKPPFVSPLHWCLPHSHPANSSRLFQTLPDSSFCVSGIKGVVWNQGGCVSLLGSHSNQILSSKYWSLTWGWGDKIQCPGGEFLWRWRQRLVNRLTKILYRLHVNLLWGAHSALWEFWKSHSNVLVSLESCGHCVLLCVHLGSWGREEWGGLSQNELRS